jgi:hypothetical protein
MKDRGQGAASMLHDRKLWGLACDMARSGDYANVIMIERALRRQGLLVGELLTTNVVKRELLTRVCHAVRTGDPDDGERTRQRSLPEVRFDYRADFI